MLSLLRKICLALTLIVALETLPLAIAAETRMDDTSWPSYGGDYSEQRFSPLSEISDENVGKLGLSWYVDLEGVRTLEATPLLIGGVLYFSANDSVVYAVEAGSGRLLWKYDPEVWKVAGKRYRQVFHVNRGVAYWAGRIYVGTFDGRLIALDAGNGQLVWSVQTLDDGATGYITGAPRAYNNKVIIGNGGTENGRSRGFVTAYDTESGEQVWRFYTVPGDPADGFENDAMAMAAKTWTGEWWKHGGGGTVWNAITYDPELDRIYIGTGNGSPWNHRVRSPGGGDNLFVCSIVALDAETGRYIWHYQTNPGETWDYTSTQDIILADLPLNGRVRKVLLHAPKNGFFYVIDRTDGRLISAEKLGKVTWADRIDLKTGRPVERPGVRNTREGVEFYPGGAGLHNWQAMSYSPQTGLSYLPKLEMPYYLRDKTIDYDKWMARPFFFNTSYDALEFDASQDIPARGSLIAWDPVKQQRAWETELPGIWNGGTLVTAGNLVFQGNAIGEFAAYQANNGDKLWSAQTGMGIVAAPMTYRLDGRQYVAILAGWGGSIAGMYGLGVSQYGWRYGERPKRLLVYVLDGDKDLPEEEDLPPLTLLDDPDQHLDERQAGEGRLIYDAGCHSCHGYSVVSGGLAPDLRASPLTMDFDAFKAVVRDGLLERNGMPKFDDLHEDEVRAIYSYIRLRARLDLAAQAAK